MILQVTASAGRTCSSGAALALICRQASCEEGDVRFREVFGYWVLVQEFNLSYHSKDLQ